MRSSMKAEGAAPPSGSAFAPAGAAAEEEAPHGNNYSRPEGQNVRTHTAVPAHLRHPMRCMP